MKTIVAIVLLSAFTAAAAEPFPPLVGYEYRPAARPLAVHTQPWFWAIWGTATVQTVVSVFLTGLVLAYVRRFQTSPLNGPE